MKKISFAFVALLLSGIMFTQAYCQSAVCNPSRASLLTGLRPNSNKVWDLWTNLRTTVPDVVTLPQYFKNNGYFTTATGKIYHNTMPDSASWSENKPLINGYPFDPDAGYVGDEALEYLEARKQQYSASTCEAASGWPRMALHTTWKTRM